MNNTSRSFHDKWHRNRDLAFRETLREGSDLGNWILSRNGWDGTAGLAAFLAGKTRVLDAGCGNGRVTALLRAYSCPEKLSITGIDLVADRVAAENLAGAPNVEFFRKDLLGDLSDLGDFDFIYCQEVLHHTADPEGAFRNLCQRLVPGGEIAIYVYKLKAPVREFVDDYIRGRISDLPYGEAMEVCRELAAFGRSLSELRVKVTVPGVSILEIPAGEYDVQRLLYHFFCKCFWSSDFDFEGNAVINYDWYHPQGCSRHRVEEVLGWFAGAGLGVEHCCVDPYGITVRGRRAAGER